MKIQTKLLVIVSFLSFICTAPAVILYYRSVEFNKSFNQIPQSVDNIADAAKLDSNAQFIRYYDEVLTQSARNYAFTGNVYWKNRYNDAAPKLDEEIKEAIEKGSSEDKKLFADIDTVNQALVAMETESISLVDQNKKVKAQAILNSEEYSKQKNIYQNDLEKYTTIRGKDYNDTLAVSTQRVSDSIKTSEQNLIVNGWITLLISFFCVAAGFTVYFFIKELIFKPLNKITKATEEISSGNLNYQIGSTQKDEIGTLSSSFDMMAKNLKESYQNVENKINERTQELTKLNKFMIDRELKMIELKKEIEALKKQNNNEN
jgi:nitrogen fixation/metabolism regulation signal transduction histidine kinase